MRKTQQRSHQQKAPRYNGNNCAYIGNNCATAEEVRRWHGRLFTVHSAVSQRTQQQQLRRRQLKLVQKLGRNVDWLTTEYLTNYLYECLKYSWKHGQSCCGNDPYQHNYSKQANSVIFVSEHSPNSKPNFSRNQQSHYQFFNMSFQFRCSRHTPCCCTPYQHVPSRRLSSRAAAPPPGCSGLSVSPSLSQAASDAPYMFRPAW